MTYRCEWEREHNPTATMKDAEMRAFYKINSLRGDIRFCLEAVPTNYSTRERARLRAILDAVPEGVRPRRELVDEVRALRQLALQRRSLGGWPEWSPLTPHVVPELARLAGLLEYHGIATNLDSEAWFAALRTQMRAEVAAEMAQEREARAAAAMDDWDRAYERARTSDPDAWMWD